MKSPSAFPLEPLQFISNQVNFLDVGDLAFINNQVYFLDMRDLALSICTPDVCLLSLSDRSFGQELLLKYEKREGAVS